MSVVIPIAIYVLIPCAGVLAYLKLCEWMDRANLIDPPRLALAILFSTYGGWLVVILTLSFWFWSGLASIGFMYLIAVAPFVLAGLAWRLNPRRGISRLHKLTFLASAGYPLLLLAAFAVRRLL